MKMSKQQYHAFVMDLAAIKLYKDETTSNVPCPACGQSKSFSLTNNGVGFLYHCFRNSCGVYGFIPMDHAVHDNNSSHGGVVARRKPEKTYTYPLIDLCPLLSNGVDWKFIQDDSYNDIKILSEYGLFYDKRSQRVYAPLTNGFMLRRSNAEQQPKSLTYHTTEGLNVFLADKEIPATDHDVVVLVEDIYSAIKVCQAGYASIALLGTSLPAEFNPVYWADEVILWLDADAIDKAVKMSNYMSGQITTNIVYTKSDPKTYTPDQIKAIIEEQCGT